MRNRCVAFILLACTPLLSGCPPKEEPTPVIWEGRDVCRFECADLAHAPRGSSGIRSVDAYFEAVGDLSVQAKTLQAEVRLKLIALATALGVENAKSLDFEGLNSAIKLQVDTGIGDTIDGGLSVQFVSPRCEVTASTTANAAAACDAEVREESSMFECKGTCATSAHVASTCFDDADLTCIGTAPGFACEGVCTGSCELDAGAECPGTCKGRCEVSSRANCDGVFTPTSAATPDGGGSCKLDAGAHCNGQCTGACDLGSGAACEGRCKGDCEYTPSSGDCPMGSTTQCRAKVNVAIACTGKCSGEAYYPYVTAACEPTTKTEAALHAVCVPPKVDVKYELRADARANFAADAAARARFEGRIQATGRAFANLTAKAAKIEAVLRTTADLVDNMAAIDATFDEASDQDPSFGALMDLACAMSRIADLAQVMADAVTGLSETSYAVAECNKALGVTPNVAPTQ